METTKVSVGKIISSTDRKYGGEGNIDTLAQSIKEHGLIHPLAVKESTEKPGYYRVIAGRRRYEAVKSLGWKTVDVIVHDKKANEESIALAENVNREDMHPLDEAETFKRQMESGKSVEEIAKYYSRSTAGIHHRIRLTNLTDDIKAMFRDGKINLAAAALISSLPPADQDKFFKKHGEKKVDKWEVCNFMRSVQKQSLKIIADKKCEKCKDRTHNTTPGLFEDDYSTLEDVCFNSECYEKKWCALIGGLIAKQTGETENNIILERLPDFLPKKSKTMKIGDQEYTLISSGGHSWKETNKKSKAKTAWLVSLEWNYKSGADNLKISRVTFEKQEKVSYTSSHYQSIQEDPIKAYMVDQIPGITEEDKKAVVEKVKAKYHSPWALRNEIKEYILGQIIIERLTKEKKPEYNPLSDYVVYKASGEDDEGTPQEIDPDYKELFAAAFGDKATLADIQASPDIQKLFMFLIAVELRTNEMPDLNDAEDDWTRAEHSMFWQFAQMTREEYTELYKTIHDIKVSEALSAEHKEEPEGLPDDIDENGLTEELSGDTGDE